MVKSRSYVGCGEPETPGIGPLLAPPPLTKTGWRQDTVTTAVQCAVLGKGCIYCCCALLKGYRVRTSQVLSIGPRATAAVRSERTAAKARVFTCATKYKVSLYSFQAYSIPGTVQYRQTDTVTNETQHPRACTPVGSS